MAKTYTLQGPISLELLSAPDALAFAGAVINAIPSYSMGTASLNIQAQGPAGTTIHKIDGKTVDALKAALAKAKDAMDKTPEDVTYDLMGRVNLVGLSIADGIGVVDAALHAIPGDSLVNVAMTAQEEGT
jgi:hypothetical protein